MYENKNQEKEKELPIISWVIVIEKKTDKCDRPAPADEKKTDRKYSQPQIIISHINWI